MAAAASRTTSHSRGSTPAPARCASPMAPTKCIATRSRRWSSGGTHSAALSLLSVVSGGRERLPGAGGRRRPAHGLVAARSRHAPRRSGGDAEQRNGGGDVLLVGAGELQAQ